MSFENPSQAQVFSAETSPDLPDSAEEDLTSDQVEQTDYPADWVEQMKRSDQEFYDLLIPDPEQRRILRKASSDRISAWLETPDARDSELEQLCHDNSGLRDHVRDFAWFWAGAGLITEEQARQKLGQVGIIDPSFAISDN